jgi:hypothetical protein
MHWQNSMFVECRQIMWTRFPWVPMLPGGVGDLHPDARLSAGDSHELRHGAATIAFKQSRTSHPSPVQNMGSYTTISKMGLCYIWYEDILG